ncbi:MULTISPECIES: PTS fructose transporter subunit IIBC [unclassified Salinivibrio]|uniref:PTS fructose transporter subunit IIBC n=1 Tax=unclassified Salinivibrio TaxID=2636825 RepID=UPI00128D2D7E|nr:MULTISPECIES: PTS fructose transporter subunit IIBC [unclassified Salinivibrio]MPS31567.1 PTS fructose transporter subunit IIBC [Salinivibrio sp. VYel7]MPX92962.1 PTS fructose transporter subunit IIBC [Salinivibrio sp. VYel9]MPX95354.1 PTS fructose transporter subunit IIBC [Salinivibrio sp. VYel6]MPX99180.1 PTS fructose transporter subunit IIBC [Salinivibrio sp. VYel4]MPY02113.1 PTS fructose transporter subunit IIBC [Salinivibrio sp. VYel5]
MNLVIVTACPSGVANTVIAAGLLEKAVMLKGWTAQIECQSSVQPTQAVSTTDIENADRVLLVGEPKESARFNGKPVYQASLNEVMADTQAVLDAAANHAQPYHAQTQSESSTVSIVGITACPTGVAHTFMAAEAVEEAAKAKGYQVKIETRGSVGAKNTLTDQEIEAADLVFIAADIEVDLSRFAGKRLYKTSTGTALKKASQTIDDALANAEVYQTAQASSSNSSANQGERTGVYKHLMTGVSHMLPLVVAGGLAIALSFVFGIEAFKEEGTLAAALMQIGGGSAFALMVPVLAGFIAFSIADRPGLAPGLIGGMLAASTGAGFLGGILAGFIAGYSAKFVADKVTLPASMEALKPILVIPLLASLFTGLVMIYVVGGPVSVAMESLTSFLQGMNSTNAVILGVVLGAMMCFDLGGPVNKAAYTFGVGLIESGTYMPMAAIMAAGMVPALGMGLSTFLAKRKFNDAEQEAGKASFVLGLCFISEGAIPFAAKDPMRVIPSCIAGGALTGAISMLIGAKLMAPHGGLFVLLIPNAISPVLMYLAAIAAGTLVTGLVYAVLKPVSQPSPLTAAEQS